MSIEWVKIYSTNAIHKLEIVKAVLENHDIEAFEINKKDSMHIHLSNAEIELYVDQQSALKAKHIITKHEL